MFIDRQHPGWQRRREGAESQGAQESQDEFRSLAPAPEDKGRAAITCHSYRSEYDYYSCGFQGH